MRAARAVAATAVILPVVSMLAACGEPDVDLDGLGRSVADDGDGVLASFRTDEPRSGAVTAEDVRADGTEDEACDGGVRRMWRADLSVEWPGDPADLDIVDTYFDGTTDFLAGLFRERGYQAEEQSFGDGAEPRWALFRRSTDDAAGDLEFRVDYQLAPDQATDGGTITTEVVLAGVTPCVER